VQTTVLGLWFGWVFLRRRRLESVIVAHAAFNTIMFALMIVLLQTDLWERGQKLLGH
jgi:membrane protease YdiL (CAAX protease family)